MIDTEDIRVEQQGEKRFYCFPDGRRYPSVTTKLQIIRKPQLEHWRGEKGNEEADRIRDEAAEIGTETHRICQKMNEGFLFSQFKGTFAWRSDIGAMARAYEDWKERYVERVLYTELVVWSDRFKYAGRIDLVAIMKGDKLPAIIDIKTSNQLDLDVPLQLVGYKEALSESRGIITGRRLAVRLDKNDPGKIVQVKEYHDHATDFRAFTYCIGLWRYFNQ